MSEQLHRDATVVDTHNDLILLVDHWDRREEPSHFRDFWLPELRTGGVDVQVLPICIEQEFQSEGALRRTLLLVERIHRLAEEHPDDVAVCLDAVQIAEARAAGKIALVIALEGAHAIGQDPELLGTMARVGVRVISMAHIGRTFLADGSGLDETSNGRLTPEGIAVFEEMERQGIVFDLSHLGRAGVEDVLGRATRPLLATHSGCLDLVDIHRNLGNPEIKAIGDLGGVVCVAAAIPMFIDPQTPTAESVVDHIEHLAETAGIDHVGIGPDFIDDYFNSVYGGWVLPAGLGSVTTDAEIRRPSDLPKVTAAMVDRGFSDDDVRKVLGGNVMRVFDEVLGVPADRD